MPIKIPDSLPAKATLDGENIFVMTEYRAMHQDIRPLNVLILNLMPTKIATETQILRKLSNTPLQVEVDLLYMASHLSLNTDEEHLSSFYTTFKEIENRNYDGMIITGAPVENLDFTQVDYWNELCAIKDKLFGVYETKVLKPSSPLFRGFDDIFHAPNSRYTEVLVEDILAKPELELVAASPEAGVYAVKDVDSRNFYVMGHPEYDPDTLAREYFRDVGKGLDIAVPENYFPSDDPTQTPIVRWRSAGQLLYTNWLNYYVYQTTPYDLKQM